MTYINENDRLSKALPPLRFLFCNQRKKLKYITVFFTEKLTCYETRISVDCETADITAGVFQPRII